MKTLLALILAGCGGGGHYKIAKTALAPTPYATSWDAFEARDHGTPTESTDSEEGVEPTRRYRCFADGPVERCFIFIGDGLFIRQIKQTVDRTKAVEAYRDLSKKATAEHGPPNFSHSFITPNDNCAIRSTDEGKKQFPDDEDAKPVPIDSPEAAAASVAGTLCAQMHFDNGDHWVQMGPIADDATHAVVTYNDRTKDPGVLADQVAYRASNFARIDAMLRDADKLLSSIVFPDHELEGPRPADCTRADPSTSETIFEAEQPNGDAPIVERHPNGVVEDMALADGTRVRVIQSGCAHAGEVWQVHPAPTDVPLPEAMKSVLSKLALKEYSAGACVDGAPEEGLEGYGVNEFVGCSMVVENGVLVLSYDFAM